MDLKTIAFSDSCQGFSGADLSALVREAQLSSLRQALSQKTASNDLFITMRDFTIALQKVFPSVSVEDERTYLELARSLRQTRGHITLE